MSVRKIWIHGNIGDVDSGVVFARAFPTQERCAKKCLGVDYVPIPSDENFSSLILIALGIRKRFPDFVSWRDSVSKKAQLPVVDIETKSGKLWPLVVIEHNGSLLCCLPTVQEVFQSEGVFSDLFYNPSITIGVALLEAIASIISNSLVSAKIKDIDTFISISLPFGRPTDLDPTNAFSLLTLSPEKIVVEDQLKGSNSKGGTPIKGKSAVSFGIQESVRCVMWDQTRVGATAEIYGSVLVKADLEGSQTDVSVAMSYDIKEKPILVGNLIFHPCVHNSSLSSMDQVLSDKSPKKIKFTPQLKKFAVCKYATNLPKAPIEGEYRMKGKNKVELQLKLTLSESLVKRKFSYFEARFPFFNRGKIRKVECKPSWGLVHLTDDKQTLVWNIGQNFQGKGVNLSLSATVYFMPAKEDYSNHPFCRDNNAYVQLEFLVPNYTLSGCYIDLKTIQISPPYKTKLETGRELRATDYKIWNCHGEIPFYAPDNIAAIEVTE